MVQLEYKGTRGKLNKLKQTILCLVQN